MFIGVSIFGSRAAGLGLAAVTAAGAALTGAAAAHAAPAPTPTLTETRLTPLALVPGSFDLGNDGLFFTSNTARTVDAAATITIDLRGLAKVATPVIQGDCAVKNLVAVCTSKMISVSLPSAHLASDTVGLGFTPLKGAPVGAQGSYTVSGTVAGYKLVGGTSTVTIGGPTLKVTSLPGQSGLRVGSTVNEPISFTNTGDRPSAGSEVLFELTPGLAFGQSYRNCEYTALGEGYTAAVCRFGGTVALGEKLQLNAPLAVKVTPQALYTSVSAYALAENDPALSGYIGSTPVVWHAGGGSALGLRVLSAGHRSSVPAGTVATFGNADQNGLVVGLQAKNTADFGVTGAKVAGRAGSDVTVNLGLANHGPATLVTDSPPNLQFTLPPGVSAVRVPPTCGLADADVPGVYDCGYGWGVVFTLPAGYQLDFPFVLRIDKVVKGAAGKVGLSGPPLPYDPNPRNNTAVVSVN
ncbi:hypothetical protein [Streptacidiphilus sp. P02-A3a]|uniref:hypothetical protein n=1 Tax=Streptacidiphilus sp. P02-A3a TaxID=2704468 RepID=UPI0015FC73EB|nr:hypothetical protein [Streptacidiphilus sp. P02-A3a]QMU68402.1 hypothetical protein GXP74_09360 [Streptacidiphilus sp. P02-A3a]